MTRFALEFAVLLVLATFAACTVTDSQKGVENRWREPGQAAFANGETTRAQVLEALGIEGMFELLDAFYVELGKSSTAHLFPEGDEALSTASKRSAAFFVQLLGGPPLFSQTYGPPRMRARHLPFEIDAAAREEWLACFFRVLDGAGERWGFPEDCQEPFRAFLTGFSSWMVNAE